MYFGGDSIRTPLISQYPRPIQFFHCVLFHVKITKKNSPFWSGHTTYTTNLAREGELVMNVLATNESMVFNKLELNK